MNKFRRFSTNEKGSTLILVVLLGLILSAMAIVALRDVAKTTQASAVYRTRTQAQATSDSAARVFSDWLGQNAAVAIDGANKKLEQERSLVTDQATMERLATMGASIEMDAEDMAALDCGGGATGCIPPVTAPDASAAGETGLFQVSNTDRTFESRRQSSWRVRVRDFVDGYPAPLWGPQFCFTKAVIAAEATIGEYDPDWTQANNMSNSRHAVDGMIGPRECGYGG